MQKRMIEFIRALRAAGLRVSLAESQDAMHAVDETGLGAQATIPQQHESHPGQEPARPTRLRLFLPALLQQQQTAAAEYPR